MRRRNSQHSRLTPLLVAVRRFCSSLICSNLSRSSSRSHFNLAIASRITSSIPSHLVLNLMGHIGYPGPVHLHVRRQARICIVRKIVQLPLHNFSCLFTRFILFVQVYSFSTINSVSFSQKRLPFAFSEGI